MCVGYHSAMEKKLLLRALAGGLFPLGRRTLLSCPELLFEERVVCPVNSFSIAFCWRRACAVQKPRAAPAEALTALSHMLIQGFFIVSLTKVGERDVL